MARTHADTQIFKEFTYGEEIMSKEEAQLLKEAGNSVAYFSNLQDDANEIFAASFSVDQKENPTWGDNLVDKLNDICVEQGKEPKWFLGDADEDYVFVD